MILQPFGFMKSGAAATYAFLDLTSIQALYVSDNSEGYTLYQTNTCSTAVTSDSDPIGSCCHSTMPDLTQATAAFKPTWRNAANGINGTPAASFDGGDYLSGGSISEANDAFTVFAVFTVASATSTRGIVSAGTLTSCRGIATDATTGYVRFRSSNASALPTTYDCGDGNPHAVIAYGTYTGPTYDVHVWADGSQRANGAVTCNSLSSVAFSPGYIQALAAYHNGKMSVCGYCQAELSGAELTGLQNQLMDMAGL